MSGTNWIVESRIHPRWPIYTRANVGEVFPEVVTPMSYDLGIAVGTETGWREAYDQIGILCKGDFETADPIIIGLFGGYCYLNVSYLRMAGVRAPGSSAAAIDATFFGEGNPPPYTPQKGDKNLGASLRLIGTVLKSLGAKKPPPQVEESYRLAAEREAAMPPLDSDDETLLAYLIEPPVLFQALFRNHIYTTTVASIVTGLLADAAAAAGEPGLATHLLGAAGNVLSASYSQEMYEISKLVRSSPALTEAFDGGIDGLHERLQAMPEAAEFNRKFADFIARHGHRGPNDWEMSARTWETTPELVLVAIDRMRLAETDLSPTARLQDMEAKQQAAIQKVLPHLKFLDKGNLKKAVKAAPIWSRAREATRDRAVRGLHPSKLVFRELVRRGAERGGTDDGRKVALLRAHTEMGPYFKDPASMMSVIEERWALRERFDAIVPPFIIESAAEIPTLEQMEAAQGETAAAVATGDVLKGDAGSPGIVRGRARVVLDPGDARGLQPGEILVAPMTDPAWTPLFLPAAAVVVNVGALMSHAVIVSRELGIPCVVAVEGATDRIADGTMLEVDGTAGTVTVIGE